MAVAELQPKLLNRISKQLPKNVAHNASRLVVRRRLPALSAWLKEQQELCENSLFSDTEVARNYINTFKHAEAVVKQISRTKDAAAMRSHYSTLISK